MWAGSPTRHEGTATPSVGARRPIWICPWSQEDARMSRLRVSAKRQHVVASLDKCLGPVRRLAMVDLDQRSSNLPEAKPAAGRRGQAVARRGGLANECSYRIAVSSYPTTGRPTSQPFGRAAPKAVACLLRDWEALLTFFALPPQDWRRVRTTNAIERAFREVRRRTRPMTCFTNPASCDRITYAVMHHLNTQWQGRPLWRESTQNS